MASSSSYAIETTDDYTDSMLKRAVAKLIMNVGFASATNVTIDYTADLLDRYMTKMMTDTKTIAEHSGRSKVQMSDVDHVFKKHNISCLELHDYIQQVRPFPHPEISEYPVEPENVVDFEKPTEEEIVERSSCIDKFLPTLYPQIKNLDIRKPELNNSNTSASDVSIAPSEGETVSTQEERPATPPAPVPPPVTPKVTKQWSQSEKKTAFPDFSNKISAKLGFKVRTRQMAEAERKAEAPKKADSKKKSHKHGVESNAPTSSEPASTVDRPPSAPTGDVHKSASPLPRPSHASSERLNASCNGDSQAVHKNRASTSSVWGSRAPGSAAADTSARLAQQEKLIALSETLARQSAQALNARKSTSGSRPSSTHSHSLNSQPHSQDNPNVKRKSREEKKEKKAKEERRKLEESQRTPIKTSASTDKLKHSVASVKAEDSEVARVQQKPDAKPPLVCNTPLLDSVSHPLATSTPIVAAANIHATPSLPAKESKIKKKKKKEKEKDKVKNKDRSGREKVMKKLNAEEKTKSAPETTLTFTPFSFEPVHLESVSPAPSLKTVSFDAPDLNDDATNPFTLGDHSIANDSQNSVSSTLTSFPKMDITNTTEHDASLVGKPHKVKKKKEKRNKDHKEKKRDKEHKKEKKKSHKEKEHIRSHSPNTSHLSTLQPAKPHVDSRPPEPKLTLKIRLGPSSGSSVTASPMQSPQNQNQVEKVPTLPQETLVSISPDDLPIRFMTEKAPTPAPVPTKTSSQPSTSESFAGKIGDKSRSWDSLPSNKMSNHVDGNGRHSAIGIEKKILSEEKKRRNEEKKKNKEKREKKLEKLEKRRLEAEKVIENDLSRLTAETIKSDHKPTDKVRLEEKPKKERKEVHSVSNKNAHPSRPPTPKIRDGEKHGKISKGSHSKSVSRSETPLFPEQGPGSSSSLKTPVKRDKDKEKEKERHKEKERQREKEKREKEKEKERIEKEREKERREREQRERQEREEREERERQRELEERERQSQSDSASDKGSVSNDIPMNPTTNFVMNIDLDNIWVCPACNVAYVEGETNMVGCDGGCDQWFHWTCVGLSEAPPEESEWFCPGCLAKRKRKRANGSSGSKRGTGAKKRKV